MATDREMKEFNCLWRVYSKDLKEYLGVLSIETSGDRHTWYPRCDIFPLIPLGIRNKWRDLLNRRVKRGELCVHERHEIRTCSDPDFRIQLDPPWGSNNKL